MVFLRLSYGFLRFETSGKPEENRKKTRRKPKENRRKPKKIRRKENHRPQTSIPNYEASSLLPKIFIFVFDSLG